jgi:hypothetical protein
MREEVRVSSPASKPFRGRLLPSGWTPLAWADSCGMSGLRTDPDYSRHISARCLANP